MFKFDTQRWRLGINICVLHDLHVSTYFGCENLVCNFLCRNYTSVILEEEMNNKLLLPNTSHANFI